MASKKNSLKELKQLKKHDVSEGEWIKTMIKLFKKGIALDCDKEENTVNFQNNSELANLQLATTQEIAKLQREMRQKHKGACLKFDKMIVELGWKQSIEILIDHGVKEEHAQEWIRNLVFVHYLGSRYKKTRDLGKQYLNSLSQSA